VASPGKDEAAPVWTVDSGPVAFNLKNRSFLKELDFTPTELRFLLRLAADLKAARYGGYERPHLTGKNIALLSERAATRTRAAVEVAAHDQGAHVAYLDPSDAPVGHRESTKDTARVLGRTYDAIEYRGYGQQTVETLARHAGVPVWNGLTDEFHPTQTLADVLTMTEHCDKPLSRIACCYLGDARTALGNSLLAMGAKLGMDVRVCAPERLRPAEDIVKICRLIADEAGARLLLTDRVDAGVHGADFLYTDTWVSTGDDRGAWRERIDLLKPYRITSDVVRRTGNRDVRFLHRLPAFHNRDTITGEHIYQAFGLDGLEVADEVFESELSVVFDQAENRLHAVKAVMVATLGD
jgi:ornithine carbamoyltransferase